MDITTGGAAGRADAGADGGAFLAAGERADERTSAGANADLRRVRFLGRGRASRDTRRLDRVARVTRRECG